MATIWSFHPVYHPKNSRTGSKSYDCLGIVQFLGLRDRFGDYRPNTQDLFSRISNPRVSNPRVKIFSKRCLFWNLGIISRMDPENLYIFIHKAHALEIFVKLWFVWSFIPSGTLDHMKCMVWIKSKRRAITTKTLRFILDRIHLDCSFRVVQEVSNNTCKDSEGIIHSLR